MIKITITNEANAALRAQSQNYHETAPQNPDGTWTFPISEDVADKLDSVVLPGETISDTIIRLCAGTIRH